VHEFQPPSKDALYLEAYNLETGEELETLGNYGGLLFPNFAAYPYANIFSPDFRMIWAVNGLWPVLPGRETRHLRGHSDRVRCVAWSPDDRLAVSGGDDGAVIVWNVETDRALRTFLGHRGPIRAVAFHPDGQHVLSGGIDGTIRLWSLTDGRQARVFPGHLGGVTCLAISGDGKLLIGGTTESLAVWNVSTGHKIQSFPNDPLHIDGLVKSNTVGFISSVAISDDGKLAMSGSHYGVVRVWEIATGKEIGSVRQSAQLVAARFIPHSEQGIMECADGSLHRFDIKKLGQTPSVKSSSLDFRCLAVSPNGQYVLTGDSHVEPMEPEQADFRIWNLAEGRVVRNIKTPVMVKVLRLVPENFPPLARFVPFCCH
jgi:WD40 repeat protein